ncbi:hypothetical protein ACSNO4_03790 [Kocuria flava]|uniref:hypothetical protein n=1 Tax=Kocuria flava TaxID=446860 RepID=UPI003F19E365
MHDKVITVKKIIRADAYTIVCTFDYPKSLAKFFSDNQLTVTYNRKIDAVPNSILYIPLLANLVPAAWALGADVRVPEIDKNFMLSLEKIREALNAMYPHVAFSGNIVSNNISDTCSARGRDAAAVLFSGGVDSLASYILNQDKPVSLITVWGADVKLDDVEAWRLVKEDNEAFGRAFDRENLFIRANVREFLNERRLNSEFNADIGRWWGRVQHGLGFLGLCAPLSFSHGFETIFIPSSHTELFSEPWGSHPTIDNHVRWANVRCVHHAYELSRQQKVREIANYAKRSNPTLSIRACYTSSTGKNCSSCEKCSRTMVGLLIEGVDPNHHGFTLNSETLEKIQRNFSRGDWHLTANEVFMWKDIQRHYSSGVSNIPATYVFFFDWLMACDFHEFMLKSESNPVHRLKRVFQMLPAPIVLFSKKIVG